MINPVHHTLRSLRGLCSCAAVAYTSGPALGDADQSSAHAAGRIMYVFPRTASLSKALMADRYCNVSYGQAVLSWMMLSSRSQVGLQRILAVGMIRTETFLLSFVYMFINYIRHRRRHAIRRCNDVDVSHAFQICDALFVLVSCGVSMGQACDGRYCTPSSRIVGGEAAGVHRQYKYARGQQVQSGTLSKSETYKQTLRGKSTPKYGTRYSYTVPVRCDTGTATFARTPLVVRLRVRSDYRTRRFMFSPRHFSVSTKDYETEHGRSPEPASRKPGE